MTGSPFRSTFPGSLVFAAFAGLAAVPWTMVTVPILWPTLAVGAYLLAAVVLHLVWIAPSVARGAMIGAVAGLFAAAAGLLSSGLTETVLAAAVLLGVAHSGFLYRSRPVRAVLIEAGLLILGLLFARLLGGPTSLGVGLGVWGFFLVQSLFFLVSGVAEREDEAPAVDPFERARKKTLEVLEASQ